MTQAIGGTSHPIPPTPIATPVQTPKENKAIIVNEAQVEFPLEVQNQTQQVATGQALAHVDLDDTDNEAIQAALQELGQIEGSAEELQASHQHVLNNLPHDLNELEGLKLYTELRKHEDTAADGRDNFTLILDSKQPKESYKDVTQAFDALLKLEGKENGSQDAREALTYVNQAVRKGSGRQEAVNAYSHIRENSADAFEARNSFELLLNGIDALVPILDKFTALAKEHAANMKAQFGGADTD